MTAGHTGRVTADRPGRRRRGGTVLLVLPGPGWLTILLGLALLAAEFAWARRLLERLKNTAGHVKRAAQGFADRRNS